MTFVVPARHPVALARELRLLLLHPEVDEVDELTKSLFDLSDEEMQASLSKMRDSREEMLTMTILYSIFILM